MARRDDMEPIGGFAKAAAARQSDKPTLLGYVTTRVLHTEREPLFADDSGMTIGQMIDHRLGQLRDPWAGQIPPADWVAPAIHSVTVELPVE